MVSHVYLRYAHMNHIKRASRLVSQNTGILGEACRTVRGNNADEPGGSFDFEKAGPERGERWATLEVVLNKPLRSMKERRCRNSKVLDFDYAQFEMHICDMKK